MKLWFALKIYLLVVLCAVMLGCFPIRKYDPLTSLDWKVFQHFSLVSESRKKGFEARLTHNMLNTIKGDLYASLISLKYINITLTHCSPCYLCIGPRFSKQDVSGKLN